MCNTTLKAPFYYDCSMHTLRYQFSRVEPIRSSMEKLHLIFKSCFTENLKCTKLSSSNLPFIHKWTMLLLHTGRTLKISVSFHKYSSRYHLSFPIISSCTHLVINSFFKKYRKKPANSFIQNNQLALYWSVQGWHLYWIDFFYPLIA